MFVAIRLLIAIMLVCDYRVSLAKKLSIGDCLQTRTGDIDCRRMGFQNVPYDIFSIPSVNIYLSKNPFICDCTMVWFLREDIADKRRIRDSRDMKCFPPGKDTMVAISKVKERDICQTPRLKMEKTCLLVVLPDTKRLSWFTCKKTMKRIPYDVFNKISKVDFRRKYIACDCDTVWFIRRIKIRKYSRRFWDPHLLFCAKGKTFSKPVPFLDVDEETICPQREPDHCKIGPCPAKVTTCRKQEFNTPPYECLDVNECLKHPCPKPEICINKKSTGYECLCPQELPVRDEITKKCIPPDPCQPETNPCPSTSKCETIRLPTKTSYRCVDLDECLTGDFDCGPGEECFNKDNGYSCHCKPGLTRNSAYSCIVNVDPCKMKPPVCDLTTQQCVTKGKVLYSYECQDIDECYTKKHDCHENAKCINTAPGYKCQCKPGFKEYDNGRQCKDLNECSDKSRCAMKAKCINLPGSFKCKCDRGYVGDGKYCKDQDECSGGSHCSVDAECNNIPGSYECTCKKGYLGNGKICKDIDECSQDKYSCPAHSECKNTPGSYTCKCLHGFTLKNDRCLDIDECKSNSHNCDKNALCINFVGSYKCRCKEGYEHLKEGRLCLKEVMTQDEDNSMFVVLIAVPVCLLVVISLSLGLYCERKNRKKRKQNSEKDEAKLLLNKQFGDDTQHQAVFMFDPRANKEAANIQDNLQVVMPESSEDESDYDK